MQEHSRSYAQDNSPMSGLPLTLHGEESLIIDEREQQSPSQHVEERLVQLLRRRPVAISMAVGRNLCRGRSQFSGAD